MRIWSLEDKKQIAVLEGHAGTVKVLAIISDNTHVVSGGVDMQVIIWSLKNHEIDARIVAPSTITAIELTSDDKYAFGIFEDNTTVIFNLHDNRQEGTFFTTSSTYFEWKVQNLKMIDLFNL